MLKVAVTAALALMVRTQAGVPLQAPDHPAKTEPEAGTAARVTFVPEEKLAPQVDPQAIPDGVLVTVPEPVPAD